VSAARAAADVLRLTCRAGAPPSFFGEKRGWQTIFSPKKA
jgi:hypothetical protein